MLVDEAKSNKPQQLPCSCVRYCNSVKVIESTLGMDDVSLLQNIESSSNVIIRRIKEAGIDAVNLQLR